MSTFLTRQASPSSYHPSGPVIHTNVSCDVCRTSPIQGVRYKCTNCPNFDMCANCESNEANHDKTHVFIKLRYPIVTEPSNSLPLLTLRVQPPGSVPQIQPIYNPILDRPDDEPQRTD